MSETAQPAPEQHHTRSFAQDPCSFLRHVASLPPSRESLRQLAGDVAAQISVRHAVSSEVACLYLQAAARHLINREPSPPALIQPFALAFAGSAAVGPSFLDPNGAGGRPNVIASETENSATRDLDLVLDAIGNAAACISPRSQISESGILPVLASMLPAPSQRADGIASIALTPLTSASVEFLQVCLYAQQYRYCESWINHSWAIPSSNAVSVLQVLRYYYIRGTIHMGCENWDMARRCFWTCLSVPSEVVSAVAIAAWKKLVLVQCRCSPFSDAMPSGSKAAASTKPLQLPLAAPMCLKRFLTSATFPPSSQSSGYPTAQQVAPRADDPEAMHMVESSDNESPRLGSELSTGGDSYPSFGVQVYKDLVDAFVRRDQTAFLAMLADHENFFRRDGNMGLVKQCYAQLLRHRVCFYSRLYSSVSLADLSSFLQLAVEQVERAVLSLSEDLGWTVSIQGGIVHFPVLSSLPNPPENRVRSEEIVQLTRLVQQLDSAVSASPKGVAIAKKGVRSHAPEAKGVEDF